MPFSGRVEYKGIKSSVSLISLLVLFLQSKGVYNMYIVYEMGVRIVLFHGLFELETGALEYIQQHEAQYEENKALTLDFIEINPLVSLSER